MEESSLFWCISNEEESDCEELEEGAVSQPCVLATDHTAVKVCYIYPPWMIILKCCTTPVVFSIRQEYPMQLSSGPSGNIAFKSVFNHVHPRGRMLGYESVLTWHWSRSLGGPGEVLTAKFPDKLASFSSFDCLYKIYLIGWKHTRFKKK